MKVPDMNCSIWKICDNNYFSFYYYYYYYYFSTNYKHYVIRNDNKKSNTFSNTMFPTLLKASCASRVVSPLLHSVK
jgi:hypothetical protein